MIESLSISKVATYGEQPETLSGLSKFNFIFGSNGMGKTTISRAIAGAENHSHCSVNWMGGARLQTLVYNRDFVEANFNPSTDIKGVFTLGEENAETLNKITDTKKEQAELELEILRLKKTLDGDDGNSGKNGDLKTLEESLKNKCWIQKQKHDAKLKGALEGYRGSSDKFKSKIIDESAINNAQLMPLNELEKRAGTIFGEMPIREPSVAVINANNLIGYESNPILSKRILGKADVDIAGMIKKLGNSDWVRQGRKFYDDNEGTCPFCQQKTEDDFANSLSEYFDEAFEIDSRKIADLGVGYKAEAERLQQMLKEVINGSSRFLDVEKLKVEKQLLDAIIAGNIQKLENKKKEPSQLVELETVSNIITKIKLLVDETNAKVVSHNATVDNISQERQKLTSQVWRFILEELNLDLAEYKNKKQGIEAAIKSLKSQIQEKEDKRAQKINELRELEKKSTSIQPTVDEINGLLKSFGFHGFSLAATESGNSYRLIRAGGADAKATLSEGERTFITFLYFYHLLKGSNSESGITNDRIVVFDDPVSSLDSDILFIVSSLIRGLFDDIENGVGYIKQVFILTHNVYFHKEVSFYKNNRENKGLSKAKFWIVRKEGLLSKIIKHDSNPIKTSYELLWSEVRTPSNSSLTIQNTLRRILENYFKILGRIDPDAICNKFEGKNKLVCKSLFSWVNDGSHSVHDDLYVSSGDTTVENYLHIFKDIFEKSGHIAHYNMMMGEDLESEVA